MASSNSSSVIQGSFISTTSMWDLQQIYSTENLSPEIKELLVRLYQNLNIMAVQLNLKDTGYYPEQQFLTNKLFFPINNNNQKSVSPSLAWRPVVRKVINFGALPNAGSTSVPHNIPIASMPTFIMTSISATATNTNRTSFISIPYASTTLVNNIEIEITATDVVITTGINRSSYTICYVVLEYITSN